MNDADRATDPFDDINLVPNNTEKHDVEDALFLVDDADDLIGGLRRENYSYRVEQHGFRNSVKRVFREVQ